MSKSHCLHTKELTIGYQDKTLLSNLNLTINKGEMICLIGANGSGKSTLIRTLLGLTPAINGTVFIQDKPLANLNLKELAKHISIVLTNAVPLSNFTVYEMVSLGRTPHTNWLGKLSKEDLSSIKKAMEMVHVTTFANRQVTSLSDGERQRVMVAKALAQDTALIILDEPTAHLDIANRVALLSLLKKVAKEAHKGILLSTHELELAIQIADNIWLLDTKQELLKGAPEDLVLSGVIEEAFKSDAVNFDLNSGSFKIEYKPDKEIFLKGNGKLLFWTEQALQKEGFKITTNKAVNIHIVIDEKQKIWQVTKNNKTYKTYSIEALKKILV